MWRLLSFQEAASFCSADWVRPPITTTTARAQGNWALLNHGRTGDQDCMWLRTAFSSAREAAMPDASALGGCNKTDLAR
jgi:hypothetical protein